MNGGDKKQFEEMRDKAKAKIEDINRTLAEEEKRLAYMNLSPNQKIVADFRTAIRALGIESPMATPRERVTYRTKRQSLEIGLATAQSLVNNDQSIAQIQSEINILKRRPDKADRINDLQAKINTLNGDNFQRLAKIKGTSQYASTIEGMGSKIA